ncbi:MAG: Asp23/Gls24 family envelope stress response protein [Chloroflexota bacterium]
MTPHKEESMGEETTNLGGIHVSPQAVATIAYHAVLESYGVVGLAPMNLADGIVKSITREPSKGVKVEYDGENINIEVHIIVEYGTRINSVAESVKNTVRYHVEKALGLKVNRVDVHVAGLRISNND